MLHCMPALMRRNTDRRNRGIIVHGIRQPQHLVARIIVVGQIPLNMFNRNIVYYPDWFDDRDEKLKLFDYGGYSFVFALRPIPDCDIAG